MSYQKSNNPAYRLNLFWGAVDQKHVQLFLPFVLNGDVLDLGCGYGSTSYKLSLVKQINVTGLDFDENELEKAKSIFPSLNFVHGNAEKMPFEDNQFSTIILKDSLHHFYEEADFEKVKSEIIRVLKPGGNLIFFDPNVNTMIKTLRRTAKHVDAECDFKTAIGIVKSMNFNLIHNSFNTLFSLPLSGGYVYRNFVPHNKILYKFLIGFENFMEVPVNALGLGKELCWRYLIVSQKPLK